MRTSKPFSTISYNSIAFLTAELNKLYLANKIAFYAFVYHYKEEDENKDHIHLYIEPNGRVDTDSFRALLVEIDPHNPAMPLKCMPFRSSKFDDWYLYSCHDEAYLASKGQKRHYKYAFNDFIASEMDYLLELTHLIDRSRFKGLQVLKDGIEAGQSFSDMVRNGVVPIQQLTNYQKAYDCLTNFNTLVRSSPTHTPITDPETGEVLNPKLLQATESVLPDNFFDPVER